MVTQETSIHGEVAPGFESVRDFFEQQFASGEHLGAGVSVYHHGKKVVDLWGGVANQDSGKSWERDTMAICYSTTKGLAATCLHICADRSLVDYDATVATYWPEFAQHGKEAITVRQILAHQAGLAPVPPGVKSGPDLFDWERVIRATEQQTPAWEPGTASGYHALTFGFLVGEIVRRVSGKSVGTFLRDEVATPLGIADEMYLGAPASIEPRVAKLVTNRERNDDARALFRGFAATPEGALVVSALGLDLDASDEEAQYIDTPAGHQSEVPAISGIMTARALARMYAALATYGELDGVRLMSEERVRKMSEVQTHRPDKVLMVPVQWSLGYMNGGDDGWPQGMRTTAFGHIGAGGSVGYADPEIAMSFGLVLNKMANDLLGAGRTASLAAVARSAAEAAG
jgi:CubicO group peptidase (beta-lactamase class C family)